MEENNEDLEANIPGEVTSQSVSQDNKRRFCNFHQIPEGNEGGDDNMEVTENPPDEEANEETPGAAEEEEMLDEDVM